MTRCLLKNSHRLAAFSLAAALAAAAGPLAGAQAPEAPAASPAEASSLPLELRLTPGQIRTLPVQRVERVAVGDPAIADVTIVTPDQLLIKAKQLGATNFIVWDSSGQHEMQVQVQLSASPEALSADVQQLLRELGLTSVRLHPQFGKIFLLGTVESDAKLVALEQAIAAFGDGIVNLVSVAPPIDVLAPLVSLSVQVLEISREDVNQLGVNWSDSFSLTESAMPVSSPRDQLLRIGEMTQRSVLAATVSALVTHNKARILSEPKLVTSSGKPASSFIGLEVPIISTSSVGSTGTNVSIEFRQTGVLLEMTPTVTDEREEITIKMKAEVSSIDTASGLQVPVGSTTVLVPGFRSRSATTEVAARSGETIVVLHHGHPVALLAPAPAGHTGITTAGHLASLAARGLLSSAIGPKRRSSRRRPRSDLSGAVGEDREGRS